MKIDGAILKPVGRLNLLKGETPQGFWKLGRKTDQCTIDANGNLVKDGEKTYTWDAANRLISVAYINPQPSNAADNVTFQYDGFGRRKAIIEMHGNTVLNSWTFIWCEGQVYEERDSTGSTVFKRFYSQGEYSVSGSTKYFYSYDHLGSVREMVDSSGVSVQAQYDYDSYGRQTQIAGTQKASFGYTRFFVEPATNLNLTWFRPYDPEKGRWLRRDPLAENVELNIYRYAGNSPINKTDPMGLDDDSSDDWVDYFDWFTPDVANTAEDIAIGTAVVAGTIATAGLAADALGGAAVVEGTADAGEAVATSEAAATGEAAEATLPENVASSFPGGEATSTVLDQDALAFRYSGGTSPLISNWLTTGETVSQISSPAEAISALNLPAGATAEALNAYLIPAGTQIFVGGVEGGAEFATQIYLQDLSALIPF